MHMRISFTCARTNFEPVRASFHMRAHNFRACAREFSHARADFKCSTNSWVFLDLLEFDEIFILK